MNKFFQIFLFSAFLLALHCEKSTEPVYDCQSDENPMNMIFSYGVTSKNILNTFECTYTKDMIVDPSITIKLILTKSELDSIYEKMIQVDFFSYPDTFKIDRGARVNPYSTYKFYVETKPIQKTLYWEDRVFADSPDQNTDKLHDFIFYIIDMIESKEEYQALPFPRGGYI